MNPAIILRTGALLGGVAVALGAFAAHGLKDQLDAAALKTFETGVRYQTYHALALLLCAALGGNRRTGAAAICFLLGVVLFSGSLYWLAFGAPRWVGPVTPIGGVSFLVGWLLLASARRVE